MARLVFRIGNVPKVLNLGTETITIGRRPDNPIAIDDGFASAVHATVSAVGGGYWLEDLKSSNGTLLNGVPVANARLKHGDIIVIGRMQIGFFDEPPAAAPDLSATMRMPSHKSGPSRPSPEATLRPLASTARITPTPVPAPPPIASAASAAKTIPVAPAPAPQAIRPIPVPPAPAPALPEIEDLDLTPIVSTLPPPSRAPAWASASSSLEGPKFIIPVEDSSTQKVAGSGAGSQGATSASDVNMLDQLVGSIRSHRDREQIEREEVKVRLKEEWDKALAHAEQLKLKISGDPRIKYFGINRRANDVMIRFLRSPSQPMQFMMLSMEHPENKEHTLLGIWLRRSGGSDRCFQTADEVAAEMIREFAFLLA